MKKIVSFLALFFLLLPSVANAYDAKIDGIYYNFSGDKAIVTAINDPSRYSGIVAIPSSVTYNGRTYNVTSIGEEAFAGCGGLTSVTIPNSVTSIGSYAFYGCSGLTDIIIPNSVTSIGLAAFYDCHSLTSVTIGNGVISIGDGAFDSCSGLTDIIIPNSVTRIGSSAFSGCSRLTDITIPNSVNSIGDYAFSGCGLTSITIPSSVTSIGNYAFSGCESLISVTTNSNAVISASEKDYDGSPMKSVFGEQVEEYIIGDNVKFISDEAFSGYSNLKSVSIGNGVTCIGENTFSGCSSLKSVNIGNSVTSIGYNAFSKCSRLADITIPNSVTSIGYEAFSDCSSLTSVTIGSSVTSIGEGAFYDCSGLTDITIPNSVTSIGSGAFDGCNLECIEYSNAYYLGNEENPHLVLFEAKSNDIESCNIHPDCKVLAEGALSECRNLSYTEYSNAYYLGNEENPYIILIKATSEYISSCDIHIECKILASGAFSQCQNLTSVTIPDGVTSIGAEAFAGCSSLISVSILESVTSIDNYAFEGCRGLTDIIIPNSVTSIGDGAFYGCSGLTSVTIGSSVTSIGEAAFYKCSGLTDITIPESVTSIGGWAFSGYSSLKSVSIGNIVTRIGDGAFYGCSGLTSITIPNSVTRIGDYAFEGCGLISVTIPANVVSIGDEAFSGCESLISVTTNSNAVISASEKDYDGSPMKSVFGEQVEEYIIGDNVKFISDEAFSGYSNLKSVSIGNGVTNIGRSTFSGCSSLTSVDIPESVTSIGDYAFSGCSGLASIAIPNGVTSIGDGAFEDCSSLTDIIIPNSVTAVGYVAFSDCGLTSITIPSSVTSIGGGAFYCESLISVTTNSNAVISDNGNWESQMAGVFGNQVEEYVIGDNVKSIGNYAFNGCESLTSITIGNSVTSIGSYAFSGCSGLTSVTIPNSVTRIGNEAFYDCSGLTSVTIGNNVTTIGNYTFSGCESLRSVTIPEGVTSIGHGAFYGCSGLTSVTIPGSVTSIGDYAFEGCSGLISVTIGIGVTSIGESAFRGCSSLTEVTIESNAIMSPIIGGDEDGNYTNYRQMAEIFGSQVEIYILGDSITTIGDYAFSDCSSLTAITIGNGVISIGKYAFSGCSSLTSVVIPESVTSIGEGAFDDTPWYENWNNNQPDGLLYVGRVAYRYKGEMPENTEIVIRDGTLGIAGYAFMGCYGLTSVTIPNSVTSIGGYAFEGCGNLASVTIPNSVTSIGDYAFQGCYGLTSISIGNSVTSIGVSAFEGCSGLTSVDIPNSVTSIGNEAFQGCYGLTSISIGNSVTSIGSRAFSGCSGLTSVTIPNSVNSIGDYAFEGCSRLTSVTIPNSVIYIGNYSFWGCYGLTSIVIPESVTYIGEGAFEVCFFAKASFTNNSLLTDGECWGATLCDEETSEGLLIRDNIAVYCRPWAISVTIPNSVTSIGDYAFSGCSVLPSITIPENVTNIGSKAFKDCDNLTTVTVESETPATIEYDTFPNSGNMTLYVPYGCSWTYRNASYWKNFKTIEVWLPEIAGVFYLISDEEGTAVAMSGNYEGDIVIPEAVTYKGKTYSVTSIGNYAFQNCSGLTSVTIPNSVTSIGYGAFSGCSGLTSVTIPESVTSIGEEAFWRCSGLTSITIPESVTSIGDDAFYGCSSLTTVTIESNAVMSVTVGWYYSSISSIFGDQVETYIIGNGVTVIGESAFSGCENLTSVTIPESVTSIGDYAFYGCSGLTEIISYINNPSEIGEETFDEEVYENAILFVPAGSIDAYQTTDGWREFENIEPIIDGIISVALGVTDEKGTDVTNQVNIVWYDAEGKEIGTGKQLNGISDSTEIYYSVLLDETMGRVYREVKMQKVVADGEPVACQLEKIGRVLLEGRVSATDIDKTTATVNVRQMLNGKWEQTYTTQTDEQGVFSVEVYDDETDITVSGDGYLDVTLHRERFGESGNVGTIPLNLISGFSVAANVTMRKAVVAGEAEDVTTWAEGLNNIEFSLTNTTKSIAITDFTVQNGNVIIKTGADVGDEISLTAKSKQGIFADAAATFIIVDGANAFDLQLTELGGMDATCTDSNNGVTVGYLYNSNGVLTAKGSYTGETLSLRHLPAGTYTLITMGGSTLLNNITRLSDIVSVGLSEGADYVAADLEIKDGELTAVAVNEVPRLDDTRFYYTSGETYFSVNKTSVTAGNYLTLQAHVDFKAEYSDRANGVTLTIDLPEGCQMVENSVIVNRQAAAHTVNGGRLTIPLTKEQYESQLRFCVIPTLNQSFAITAMASFDIDGQVTQPIGTAQFEAKGLSLSVPKYVVNTNVTINGTAIGHSDVSIYDNDVLIGKTTSKADGSWTAECELFKPYSYSFHDIYAKITTESGMELTSEVRQVEYDKNGNVPEKVQMTFYNDWMKKNIDVEFNLVEGTTTPSSYPFYHGTDFTFLADFTRNDSTEIKEVNIKVLNGDGTVRTLPATFDGKQNKWVATTKYSSSSRLPQNVTVEYDLVSSSIIYDAEMEEAMNNLINNMAIEVDNAYKDCDVELTAETENTISFLATTNGYDTKEYFAIMILDYEQVKSEYTDKQLYHIEDDATDICFVMKELDDYRNSMIAWDNKNKTAFEISSGEVQSANLSKRHRILPFILNATYCAAASIFEYNLRMNIIDDWVNTYESDKGRRQQDYENMIKKLYAKCPDGSYKIKDEGTRNSLRAEADQCLNNARQFIDKFGEVLTIQHQRLQSVCIIKGLTGMAISAAGRILKGVGTVFSNAKGAILQSLGRAINNHAISAGTILASNGTSDALGYVVEHPEGADGNRQDITPEKIIADWYFENSPKLNDMFVKTSYSIRMSYSDCKKDEKDEEENEDEPRDEKSDNKDEFKGKGTTPEIDPSGYVYEAVTSNRLEGVTVTCYQKVQSEDMYGDITEEAVVWNAEDYSQRNPLKTDETGFYRWDVPQGLWQVKYEKEGYETTYSDWLPVPPPQLDVNIGMKQSTPPSVTQMRGTESGITINLSKYMRSETMTTANITATQGSKAVQGSIVMLNAEQAPLSGETYVQQVKLVPQSRFHVGDEVTVVVSQAVESYCGVTMTKDHVEMVLIEPEITDIVVDNEVTVNYGGTRNLQVVVLPKDASAGRKLHVMTSSAMIASVSSEEVTIGQDGMATLTIGGELPGGAVLDFSVDGSDMTATSKVKVVTGRGMVAAPKASIASGSEVEKGTQITLSCETEGATIYYTLDGSCPCDENGSRMVYDGTPIVITKDVTIKAMAVAPDGAESEVVEFVYVIGTGIDELSVDEDVQVYPLPVHDKLNVTAGGKLIKSVTVSSTSGAVVAASGKPSAKVTLDVSHIPAGIYIVAVTTEKGSYSCKIVKEQ